MEKLPVNRLIKPTFSDRVFDIVNMFIMVILLFAFAWPLWFVVIASFSLSLIHILRAHET